MFIHLLDTCLLGLGALRIYFHLLDDSLRRLQERALQVLLG